jgi:dTDP-4-amino-4,6-dideoxygalactose transaminase
MIRLTVPPVDENDIQAVLEVLVSGRLVQGERVRAFEEAVARHVGVPHTVALSSGTAALHVSLLALGVGPGDRVAVPAYSFAATAHVVSLCGASPVFVDILPDSFNMDPAYLEQALETAGRDPATSGPVRAVMPVHAFGRTADMETICRISDRYGAAIVEDAACALGASRGGRCAGAWGRLGCFSFHPRKSVTTGEGGMITVRDPDLLRRIRAYRNHGQDPQAEGYAYLFPGFNYRMTEIQAALGLSQMNRLAALMEARKQKAGLYDLLLRDSGFGLPPSEAAGDVPAWQSYVVLLPDDLVPLRQAIMEEMKSRGIETGIGTLHLPLSGSYKGPCGYREGDFPVTDDIYKRSLTLPLYPGLTEDQVRTVCMHLLEAARAVRGKRA